MTWPAVLDGIGALFVRCDNDPGVQLARIPGVTWAAVKVNGTDITDPTTINSWVARAEARGIAVGSWVYCDGPPDSDVIATHNAFAPPFVIYDVEAAYKTDEAGPQVAGWCAQLVSEHRSLFRDLPAAVTSYGAYKNTIDFGAFAKAGWPILAQVYGSFKPGDEKSYRAVYPEAGIHQLRRSLTLQPGQAVYRPEGIDGA